MTLEEALNLRDGDYVTHRTHVDWRGATPVQIPPKGKVYDRIGLEWITRAELEQRQEARQKGNAA